MSRRRPTLLQLARELGPNAAGLILAAIAAGYVGPLRDRIRLDAFCRFIDQPYPRVFADLVSDDATRRGRWPHFATTRPGGELYTNQRHVTAWLSALPTTGEADLDELFSKLIAADQTDRAA